LISDSLIGPSDAKVSHAKVFEKFKKDGREI